jgi:hypothetical protein
MKTLFKKFTIFMATLFVAGLLAWCSMDGPANTSPTPDAQQDTWDRQEPTSSEWEGTVVFALSNQWFDVQWYSEFDVTIENIEVYTAAQERVTVEASAATVDLVALKNSQYALWIGEEDLDLATITQVRFDLHSMQAMQGDAEITFQDIDDVEIPIQATVNANQHTYVVLDLQGTQADIQMDTDDNYYFSPTVAVTVLSEPSLYIEQEGGEDRIRSDGGSVAGEFSFSLRVYNEIEINDANDDTNDDVGTWTIIDLDADTNVEGQGGIDTDTNGDGIINGAVDGTVGIMQ